MLLFNILVELNGINTCYIFILLGNVRHKDETISLELATLILDKFSIPDEEIPVIFVLTTRYIL